MKQAIWVVTFHFGRGQSTVIEFTDKKQAEESVRIGVFNNEDCINCSIYRRDAEKLESPLETTKRLLEMTAKALSKM